jgi:hypothetical protein
MRILRITFTKEQRKRRHEHGRSIEDLSLSGLNVYVLLHLRVRLFICSIVASIWTYHRAVSSALPGEEEVFLMLKDDWYHRNHVYRSVVAAIQRSEQSLAVPKIQILTDSNPAYCLLYRLRAVSSGR